MMSFSTLKEKEKKKKKRGDEDGSGWHGENSDNRPRGDVQKMAVILDLNFTTISASYHFCIFDSSNIWIWD